MPHKWLRCFTLHMFWLLEKVLVGTYRVILAHNDFDQPEPNWYVCTVTLVSPLNPCDPVLKIHTYVYSD